MKKTKEEIQKELQCSKKAIEIIERSKRTPLCYLTSLESINNFDSGYGADVITLKDKDIEELKKGHPLWFDDGEYSHILIYKSEK